MFMCYCRPQKKERDECFAIELGECDGGAELGKIRKTIVTIVNDDGKWTGLLQFTQAVIHVNCLIIKN